MADIRYVGKCFGRRGQAVQVRLRDNTFDDDPTEFALESVRLTRGRRGAHPWTPIRGSAVQLVGLRMEPTDLEALLFADVGRFTMDILHAADQATIDGGGGTLYWRGIVQTDLVEDPTAVVKTGITVGAVDGLSLLRDVAYLDDGEPYTGRERHIDTLYVILPKIGFDMGVAAAAHWYPDEGEAGDLLWLEAEEDVSRFYDSDGVPMSCYEVLKQLLYPYGGLLFQRSVPVGVGAVAARWCVVQKSLIGAQFPLNVFPDVGDWVHATTTEFFETTIGDPNDVSEGKLLSGSRAARPAVGSARITYAHGLIPPLIPALTDDNWIFGTNGGEALATGTTQQFPSINDF